MTMLGTLKAHTYEITKPDEPLAWLGSGGFAWLTESNVIITSGTAVTVDATQAIAALRAIDGEGAIACGALPFTSSETGQLTIPSRVLRCNANLCSVTEIEGATLANSPQLAQTPRRFSVEAAQDLTAWDEAVASALAQIEDTELRKVVLAREVFVQADHAYNVAQILSTLAATQPGCFVYAAGDFVGASPELLVRRDSARVTSRPMAGTVARRASIADDNAAIETLRASMKDAAEHRYVVDAVVAALTMHCVAIEVSDPEPVPLATVTHLTTEIRGELRSAATALDLALALHPTPAVGGTPTDSALRTIAALEPFSRGSYGGPVGWVDATGDGEFAVALRCAQLEGNKARLIAGAGIVEGSDPDLEWAETQAKLEPMLRALVRP